jgi:hypothetical protein
MRRPRRNKPLLIALYLNAALLGAVLLVLLTRGPEVSLLPSAYGQGHPPIAGGAGLFMMPGQFSERTFGVYIMDVDANTLCAYQYIPGERNLRLVAARHFRHDRRLQNYNTENPTPEEVRVLVEKQNQAMRGAPQPEAPATTQENR